MIVFGIATVLAVKIPRTQIVQNPDERQLEIQEIKQPSILLAGSAMAVIRIAVGAIVFLSAFSFKDDKIALGVVLGSYAIGGFVGNLVAPVARRHVREEVMLVTCLLGASVFVLLGALTGGGVGGAAFAAIAVATASAAGRVGFDSLLQRDGPDAVRGRAFAKFETRFQVAWVIGALFGIIPFGEGRGPSRPGARPAHRRPLLSGCPALRAHTPAALHAAARGRRPRVRQGTRRAARSLRALEARPTQGRRGEAQGRSPTRPPATAGAAPDAPTQPPPGQPSSRPRPPQRRRRSSSAKTTGEPPDVFPGGS